MRRPLGALLAVVFGAAACGRAATPPVHEREHPGFHKRFVDAASWASVFDDPARDAWQKPSEVVALLGLAPGMTVADVGAGTGYFEPWLARAVAPRGRVLALDVEPDMVAWIRARAAREGLVGVLAARVAPDDPALPPGGVDRVLVVDTWHHLQSRVRYAERLRAGLAPGGLVVVVDFTRDAPVGPPLEHRLAPEEVATELAEAGLVPSVAEETLPHQFVVVGRRP